MQNLPQLVRLNVVHAAGLALAGSPSGSHLAARSCWSGVSPRNRLPIYDLVVTDDGTEAAVAEFTWNKAEYVTVVRDCGFLGKMLLLDLFSTGFFLLVATVFLAIHQGVAALIWYGGGVFCGISGFGFTWYGLPRSLWRRSPGLRRSCRYTFSPSGVSMHSDSLEVNAGWNLYVAAYEYEQAYVLRVDAKRNNRGLTILKRGFPSQDDEAAFRGLLRTCTQTQVLNASNLDLLSGPR